MEVRHLNIYVSHFNVEVLQVDISRSATSILTSETSSNYVGDLKFDVGHLNYFRCSNSNSRSST